MTNALVRLVLRAAYRLARAWWFVRRPEAHGAFVAVWHADRLLLVRNSYRGGECVPCDTNCDGSIDLTDIEPFIGLLFGDPQCDEGCSGDTNNDGSVDLTDIEGFIECLLG